MNSIIIEKSEIQNIQKEQSFALTPYQCEHLLNVINIKVHDILKGTILGEGLCKLQISSIDIDKQKVFAKIISYDSGIKTSFEALIGASRPQTMKKVIEHGTTLGIRKFHIYKAELSEKSYLQSKIYDRDEFQKLCRLGLSQSTCYFQEPEVILYKNIFEAMRGLKHKHRFTLSPSSQRQLSENSSSELLNDSVYAFGPERGFTSKELDILKDNGFKDFSLGPSILPVEHAIFSSFGYLNQIS